VIDCSLGYKKDGSAVLFIAGTDTSVGKTLICSLLLGFFQKRDFKALCQKWVSTGGENPDDLLYILQNNSPSPGEAPLDILAPYCFGSAASPHLAAEKAGRSINPEVIKKCLVRAQTDNEVLLVEGTGGLHVPLSRNLLLVDLVARLELPVLLVARSGLGTLNHTLLSIESLQNRGMPLLGIVFSDERHYEPVDPLVNDNMRIIREITGFSVLGRLPRCTDYQEADQAFRPIGENLLSIMLT